MLGKTINGYTLKHQLGVGGMAEVWLAENALGKKAAVKLLLSKFCDDESVKSRFYTEAKVMVELNHPNIRQVYDLDELDGRPAIIMEYLEGDDLKALMKQGRRFTDEELKRWWNQLVDALNYTHARGVVHRDIKPSNIFIDLNGDVKLLDFGIAKVADTTSGTMTGSTLGTRIYMSPEQVKDPKRVDYRTDLYSLAVTFVHLLTGKAPYDSTTTSDFEIQVSIVSKPVNLSLLPKEWQAFLAPYLEKDPDKRPELRYFETEGAPSYTKPTTNQEPFEDEDEGTVVEDITPKTPTPQKPTPQKSTTPKPTPTPQNTPSDPPKSKKGLWILLGVAAAIVVLVLLIKPKKEDPYSNNYSYPSTTTQTTQSTSSYSSPESDYSSSYTSEPTSTQIEPEVDDYVPGDAINGVFSVSPTKKVYFAEGNLQYQPSTDSWNFAENQWDYRGTSDVNISISSSYNGWIDLFCWGTGDRPTMTSQDEMDYLTFHDWADNFNSFTQWRTPTADEWDYLFNKRSNASSKHGSAIVNGVAGIVILPDDWNLPSGCSFSTSYRAKDFSTNNYSRSEWIRMEKAGAVFLPAAGRRDGTKMLHMGTDGDYWSSTSYGTGRAYNVDFCDAKVLAKDNSKTKQAFAVRLIVDK